MVDLRTAEIAEPVGCLDDGAFPIDGSVDADALRELVRSRNTLLGRGKLVYRFLAAAQGDDDESAAYGAALLFAWPGWQQIIPVPVGGLEVAKTPGMTTLRLALRLRVDAAAKVEVFLATRAKPLSLTLRAADLLQLTGDGTSQRETKDDCACAAGDGETIGLHLRGVIDPDADAALDTGTYGGTSTGTVTAVTAVSVGTAAFLSGGAAWNLSPSAEVQDGGYVVTFFSASDGRVIYGPVPIVDTYRLTPSAGKGLVFAELPGARLTVAAGDTYKITKVPAVRIYSAAIYEARRTA